MSLNRRVVALINRFNRCIVTPLIRTKYPKWNTPPWSPTIHLSKPCSRCRRQVSLFKKGSEAEANEWGYLHPTWEKQKELTWKVVLWLLKHLKHPFKVKTLQCWENNVIPFKNPKWFKIQSEQISGRASEHWPQPYETAVEQGMTQPQTFFFFPGWMDCTLHRHT